MKMFLWGQIYLKTELQEGNSIELFSKWWCLEITAGILGSLDVYATMEVQGEDFLKTENASTKQIFILPNEVVLATTGVDLSIAPLLVVSEAWEDGGSIDTPASPLILDSFIESSGQLEIFVLCQNSVKHFIEA